MRAINAIDKVQNAGNSRVWTAGHTIAQRERLATGCAAVTLFARHLAHTGIEEPCALRGGVVVIGRVGGSEVAIREALGKDGFGLMAVQGEPLGLLVLFVPVEGEPAQPVKDGAGAGLSVALDVGVVQAQHHGSVIVARVEPVEDKRAGAAHVKKTGGRGRKADARRRERCGD